MNDGHIAAELNTKDTNQEAILRYALGQETLSTTETN